MEYIYKGSQKPPRRAVLATRTLALMPVEDASLLAPGFTLREGGRVWRTLEPGVLAALEKMGAVPCQALEDAKKALRWVNGSGEWPTLPGEGETPPAGKESGKEGRP